MAGWLLGYFGKKAYDDLTTPKLQLPHEAEHDGVWSRWMQGMLQGPGGSLTLKDICLPGSHDAGMHKAENQTPFGSVSVTRTQWFPIVDQLHLGVRVFDLRPVWSHNNVYTGHYGSIAMGPLNSLKAVSQSFKILGSSDVKANENWQGANGELFDDIINAVNEFLSKHSELIILDLSDNNWFDVTRGFDTFDAEQLDKFFAKLKGIKYLWKTPTPGKKLSDFTLNEFIGKGGACICIVPSHAEAYSGWKSVDECGFFKKDWHWFHDGKSKSNSWYSISEQMTEAEYVINVIKDRAGDVVQFLPPVAVGKLWNEALLGGTVNGLPDSVLKRALFKNSGILPVLVMWHLTNVLQFKPDDMNQDGTLKIRLNYQVAQADAVTDGELAHQCLIATTLAAGLIKLDSLKPGLLGQVIRV